MSKLYRVTEISTNSYDLSERDVYWRTKALYCGYDRDEARLVYHENKVEDYGWEPGNPARRTVAEIITDAGTADFDDDEIGRE